MTINEFLNRKAGLSKKEKHVDKKIWKKVGRRNNKPGLELELMREEEVDRITEMQVQEEDRLTLTCDRKERMVATPSFNSLQYFDIGESSKVS